MTRPAGYWGFDLSKEFRPMLDAAIAAGWTVTGTKGGHVKWKSPQGKMVVTSRTPSDHRAMHNARSSLRRLGLDI